MVANLLIYKDLKIFGAVAQLVRASDCRLFAPDFDPLLYDVTSTYFEGQCKANPQARYGYSRDHRPECKQVCIALVATRDGFPLGYEVFDGNRGDVFRKVPNRFHDFSPPPWGRAYPEALTYLWVLVIVTFIAEATGNGKNNCR